MVGAFSTLISTMNGTENQVGNYGLEQCRAKWNRHIQSCPTNKRMCRQIIIQSKTYTGLRTRLNTSRKTEILSRTASVHGG